LDTRSGKTILRAHKPLAASGREASTLSSKSRGAYASAEYAFEGLLHDSVTEVFNGILGKIAGQALVEAVKRHNSSPTEDPLGKPALLHQVLISHLGSVAHVLERKILKTLAGKAAAGLAPRETDRLDFVSEVEKIRKQFLKRKQACDQPQNMD
jgi:hypothetical protein